MHMMIDWNGYFVNHIVVTGNLFGGYLKFISMLDEESELPVNGSLIGKASKVSNGHSYPNWIWSFFAF